MLLLLQIRQRMTARQLADELGVSERTVLRDVMTLADADIPVFAEQGRYGGIVLLPGSQLDVNRLTPSEVDALQLLASTRPRQASSGSTPRPPGANSPPEQPALPEPFHCQNSS